MRRSLAGAGEPRRPIRRMRCLDSGPHRDHRSAENRIGKPDRTVRPDIPQVCEIREHGRAPTKPTVARAVFAASWMLVGLGPRRVAAAILRSARSSGGGGPASPRRPLVWVRRYRNAKKSGGATIESCTTKTSSWTGAASVEPRVWTTTCRTPSGATPTISRHDPRFGVVGLFLVQVGRNPPARSARAIAGEDSSSDANRVRVDSIARMLVNARRRKVEHMGRHGR